MNSVPFFDPVLERRSFRVPGDEEGGDSGMALGDAVGKLLAAHLRHDDVGDEHVDRASVVRYGPQGRRSVLRFQNRVSVPICSNGGLYGIGKACSKWAGFKIVDEIFRGGNRIVYCGKKG
jgi:hypothetical protein